MPGPRFDCLTVFLDANGRLHAYDGAGIIDIHRLDGLDRAAAIDRLRNAIDADYARAVVERTPRPPWVTGRAY